MFIFLHIRFLPDPVVFEAAMRFVGLINYLFCSLGGMQIPQKVSMLHIKSIERKIILFLFFSCVFSCISFLSKILQYILILLPKAIYDTEGIRFV